MLSFLPQYTHIVNPKLKHIYLRVDEKGNLIIKSPKVSQKRIEQLLLKKSAWINRAREKICSKKGRPVDFLGEGELYYLGKSYPLHITPHEMKRAKLTFEEACFTLMYHQYDEVLFQTHIDHFYKTKAKMVIPSLVEKWAQKMRLYPTNITFRKTKRQWGSCSTKNTISFNTMIMKLPQHVIEYIIVHELAHIKHKHHQKAFWELVSEYLPNYKALVAELKTYH